METWLLSTAYRKSLALYPMVPRIHVSYLRTNDNRVNSSTIT